MFKVAFSSALLGTVMLAAPAFAQSSPPDIPGVMRVCTPVIGEEYDGDKDRWGQCIAAVQAFLDAIGTPQASTDATVADLVVALTELYRDDPLVCKQVETELPIAIRLAADRVTDEQQKIQIIEISVTIADCAAFATAGITPFGVPASRT